MDNLGYKNWGSSPVLNGGQDRYDSYNDADSPSLSFYGSKYSRKAKNTEQQSSINSSEFDYGNDTKDSINSPGTDMGERFINNSQSKGEDHYDFEISNDNDDYDEGNSYNYRQPPQETKVSVGRRSIDDRAKEILERNKSKSRDVNRDDDQFGNVMASYESTLKDLMEGISVPAETPELGATGNSAFSVDSIGKPTADMKSIESPTLMDSFELSAADLEVIR